ncbi:hypothetical protein OIV83_005588 [Microbotryomycetes sp. JL201]|nr:hypothetical protein OIV83_005588 [Microbotryomycetes sp. JL201]
MRKAKQETINQAKARTQEPRRSQTQSLCGTLPLQLVSSSRLTVAVLQQDALRFLRVRTRHHELIITPDEQYILTVVQELTQ